MSQYLNRMYGSNPYLTCFLVSSTKIDAVVRSLFAQLKLFCSFKEKNKFQYLHRLNRNQRFALRFFTSSTSFVKDFLINSLDQIIHFSRIIMLKSAIGKILDCLRTISQITEDL